MDEKINKVIAYPQAWTTRSLLSKEDTFVISSQPNQPYHYADLIIRFAAGSSQNLINVPCVRIQNIMIIHNLLIVLL